ncbi:ATP-binding protein [Sulfitobacter sp. D35]|uniref:sensor histidine kinase n=1 Tax=Sulfitobacter sp. D35 TaxID=3083252 RepID=UPI00296F5579|nr:ATP-binding protein [Sulfitobacter sp. D35]MDW4498799.1 ATP-binding protein [Sulfitobacter sp. D35]
MPRQQDEANGGAQRDDGRGLRGSLRARLAVGAGLIGLIAVLASGLTIYGMGRLSRQVETAVEAERHIQRFSDLANQVGSLIVVLYEIAQSGIDAETRQGRVSGLAEGIGRSFDAIRSDLEAEVGEAAGEGLDAQSRRATQSIGIARMEALVETTLDRFRSVDPTLDSELHAARLQGQINAFSIGFDPLLNAAITEERRVRDAAIAEIGALRSRLTRVAVAVGLLALLLVSAFYLALVRPQLSRLDRLRQAAQRIGAGDFAVDLPSHENDEIGGIFKATNAMAAALAQRRSEVDAEWGRLNQTIDMRTDELRRANAALEKIDEDRRRFFADVSHELRTPLTVILMEADLALKAGAPADGPYGTIRNRARRLNRRIDDLLRIARSESGLLNMEAERFDLRDAAAAALDDMRSIVAANGMEAVLDPGADLPVTGDPNWVRQVATGLIENAVRHAREGRRIRLSAERTGDTAALRVIDNGRGIPPGELSAVTRRFVQAPGAPKPGGFGIGLAFATWIIEQQGGRLEIDSPVPAELRLGDAPGTLVTVFLPLHSA